MKTTEYLALMREAHGLTSDYQLSKLLGVDRSRISNYRRGISKFDDAMCIKVADVLGLPEGAVLADIQAERAHDDAVKRVWQQVAEHFRKSAAALVLIGVFGLGNVPGEAVAAPAGNSVPAGQYILCKIRRRWREWRDDIGDALDLIWDIFSPLLLPL